MSIHRHKQQGICLNTIVGKSEFENYRRIIAERNPPAFGSTALISPLAAPKRNYLTHLSHRFRYVYVEVPKAGCTAVKKLLQLAEVDGDRSRVADNVHDRPTSPLLSPADPDADFERAWNDGTYFRFTFVRNPYTRVLSAYLDKLVTNEWERERRLPQLGFRKNARPTFTTFLERIIDQDPVDMDIHWTPQTQLLGLPDNTYDRVYRFEDFQPGLRRMLAATGIPVHDESVIEIPAHPTAANSRVAEHYGAREIDLVSQLYADDFRHLGYDLALAPAG